MKRLIYGLSLIAALTFNQSCSMEEEDLFDMSAMERLELKKEETFKELFSASNGWVMEYFPTYEANIPGYVLLVKFEQRGSDGVAQFAAKCDITGNKYVVTDGENGNAPKTAFDIDFSNGPILTFNSRNELFHKFSDPIAAGLPHDQGTGVGIGGDYEFIIIDVQPGEILLKGKKRGTYTVLRKLDENQDWKEYFEDLEKNKVTLFDNPAPLKLVSGDRAYYLYNGENSVFDAVKTTENELVFARQYQFLLSNRGIRFISPFAFEDEAECGQDFDFDSENFIFKSDDGSSYITECNPLDFYNDVLKLGNGKTHPDYFWQIDKENMSEDLKTVYKNIENFFKQLGIYSVRIFLSSSDKGDILYFKIGSVMSEWVKLNRSEETETSVKFILGEERSTNFDAICSTSSDLKVFVDMIVDKQYNFTFPVKFNGSDIRLTNTADNNYYFNIKYTSFIY